ncbi:MAG: transcriptional regulator, partial [Actinomycetia bacterium]|nr:transcriptional regulator [Actinomycetes bacterium]
LGAHMPAPAVVVDRHWNVVTMNEAAGFFVELVDPSLLVEPLNALRLTLHPDGLLGRVSQPGPLAAHLFHRVRRQAENAADPVLGALVDELEVAVGDLVARTPTPLHPDTPALEVEIEYEGQRLSFVTTMTTFGTPLDVGASELALETFHPADNTTREFLHHRLQP